jgi:DnaJ-class molecular chaperone
MACILSYFGPFRCPVFGVHYKALSDYIRVCGGPRSESSSTSGYQQEQPKQAAQSKPETESPYDILGVSPNASKEEVAVAYRKLAQMYHPDKVASLAPEFRELAEKRMKAINAAYEQLEHQS